MLSSQPLTTSRSQSSASTAVFRFRMRFRHSGRALTVETTDYRAAIPHQPQRARPPHHVTCCGAEDEQTIICLGTRVLSQSTCSLCETANQHTHFLGASRCNSVAVKSTSSTATRKPNSFRDVRFRCYNGSPQLCVSLVLHIFKPTLLLLAGLSL